MACTHCPFEFSDASEEVQNLGCLPTPHQIVKMKELTGHDWACHSKPTIKCRGLHEYEERHQLDFAEATAKLINWIGVHGRDENIEGTFGAAYD